MFFFFMDGKKLFETVKNFLPMKLEHENYLIHTLKETTDAVVFGQVFIAVLQGVLAALGFWIIGVDHALLLGSFIIFLGVIPFFGPALVWAPLATYFIITGIQLGSLAVLGKGVIIAVFGIAVLSAIENLLKPKIIGDKAKLHPALVFLGVIGGLSLFGFIGFFLGPIILAVLFTLIKIYEKEKLLQLKKRA
jgi:predicted PurR-regulated permease PerM